MKRGKKMLFRCNQNEKSGFGHFSRCLNFARLLQNTDNFKPTFLGNYNPFSLQLLNHYKIEYRCIEEDDFSFFDKVFFSEFNYLVIDSYLLKQSYIDEVVKLPLFSIFIDDTCELNFDKVDLVVNFRIGAESFGYSAKQKALGPKYFIFKPEFLEIRNKKQVKEHVKKILLFFGGVQVLNSLVDLIIQSIKEVDSNIEILYIANDFAHLSPSSKENVKMIKPSFAIEKSLAIADAVINGGGLIKYECNFCKIPSASISTTKLQYEDTLILEKKGILCDLGYLKNLSKEKLSDRVKEFITNSNKRKEMVRISDEVFTNDSIDNLIKLMI